MIQEDFYTGEPVNTGSPNFTENFINTGHTAEAEAANMANFGAYGYQNNNQQYYNNGYQYNQGYNNPNQGYYNNGYQYNQMYNNPNQGYYYNNGYQYNQGYPNQQYYNNGYQYNQGYNSQQYYNQQPQYFTNQYNTNQYNAGYANQYQYNQAQYNGGIGAPPPQYSQYGNLQPTYHLYKQQQPQQAFGFNGGYQEPEVQTTYFVPGINLYGEYLPPMDYEDQIYKLQMEYMNRCREIEVEQALNYQSSPYGYQYNQGYGYNYYGMPYNNPYQYTALDNEFRARLDAIREEARQNRIEFSKNISRLAHNFANQPISEEKLTQIYEGYTMDIPQAYIQPRDEYLEQIRFRNMVPFDNSYIYREHRAKVASEIQEILKPDMNMKEAFDAMGELGAKWAMEDEMHRRKTSPIYTHGVFDYMLKKKLVERKAQKGYSDKPKVGHITDEMYNNNYYDKYDNSDNKLAKEYVANNPILSKVATVDDDGTLNISFDLPSNVGSHSGENYSVNAEEAEYERKKRAFEGFIDSIPIRDKDPRKVKMLYELKEKVKKDHDKLY
jgi:hypothetical protein